MKKPAAIPHDTTAESYVLGSLMLHSDIIDEWDELNAEYFFLPAHQSILAAITTIRAGGGMPDLLTVTQRLDERGELERVGGPGVLTEMYSHGGGRDLNYHVAILRDYMARRRILDAAGRMSVAAKDPTVDVEEVLAQAGESILSVDMSGKPRHRRRRQRDDPQRHGRDGTRHLGKGQAEGRAYRIRRL
jgi:replicative DNA helicase